MNGAPLPVERRGRGPAIMLLHGFTGRARGMDEIASALQHEYDVIAPDLPGHGRAAAVGQRAGHGFDDCIDDLVATLLASGHQRAHWIGYSMGARLALGCAVRHPQRVASLALIAARAGIESAAEREARRRADEALALRIESAGLEEFVDAWMAQPIFATQRRLGAPFLAQQRAERMANDAAGLAAALRALGPGAQPSFFDELAGIAVPALLVAGELDHVFVAAARDLARRMPHAQACEIADAGHAVHLEQPAAFVHAVQDFLRRAPAPAHDEYPIPVEETAT
ncbi:MAG: 2-succinyl-6-hydroxy-2,4-cyclohexadiene-1-carboxylate synthase [Steroidobacteraceae bacterium]